MDIAASNQTSVKIQLGMFESIIDLLSVKPVFLIGIVLVGIVLVVIFRKNHDIPKIKTSVALLIMYYYLCLMLTNIVGMPTLSEYIRVLQIGETIFHPNINLIPFSDGLSLSFMLNFFLFIPLGFLAPLVSRIYECAKNTFFIGLGLSVFIEISQLFTLYRATDINDLLTNVIGAMAGYLCFRLIARLRLVKLHPNQQSMGKDSTAYLPVIVVIVAIVVSFFS
ncbi:MAG: VanZ family protein [Hespellia sp.]|nr:VanZ family protein [Hespellia sp.]